MSKKVLFFLALALCGALSLDAQKGKKSLDQQPYDPQPSDDEVINKKYKPNHDSWKKGDYPMPGRPRDMWTVGLNAGHFTVSGDVATLPGFGVGLHVRKSLGYSMSIRGGYFYGMGRGLSYKPSQGPSVTNNQVLTGLGYTGEFYYNYKTTYHQAYADVLFNLNNLLFHRRRNKVAFYLGAGLGMNAYQTKYDALDANGNTYEAAYNLSVPQPGDPGFGDRKEVRSALRDIMDGNYETIAEQDNGFNIGLGDLILRPTFHLAAGVDIRISKRVSLTIDHKAFFTINDDLIDGKRWAEQGDLTGQMDVPHYTSIGVNVHLGKKKKRTEPFWFINPLNQPMAEIADHKKKIDELSQMLADDDNDGVPNRMDKEPNTPPDTRVDTRGVTLDSDGDGIADSLDKEPFSPPGFPTDNSGVAQVPKYTTEKDVVNIGDDRYVKKSDLDKLGGGKGTLKDWFLPMIHFDLDKSKIKTEFFPELKYVATVMQKYPDMKVIVNGHTDIRNGDCYNEKLSYNRAKAAIDYLTENYKIDRSRLILQYGGEKENMVKNANNEKSHYMNRRVEFFVAPEGGAKDMPEPNCKTSGTENGKTERPVAGQKPLDDKSQQAQDLKKSGKE